MFMTETELQDAYSTKTQRNQDAIDRTYYEYHGRHDDGDSPADNYGFMIEEGIAV